MSNPIVRRMCPVSVVAFAADPQCVKPLMEGVGIKIAPGVGMNLISSLPCTSVGAVSVVGRGDVREVGNRDVVEDVDGDQDVSP